MGKPWLTGLFLALMTAPLCAQTPPPPGPGILGQGTRAPREKNPRRREMAKLFLVQRMRETLSLTDAQTLKVMDVIDAIDRERTAEKEKERALVERVASHLDSPSTPDGTFLKDVSDYLALRETSEKKMKQLESELLAVLTPRQRTRFLVLRRRLLGGGPDAERPGPGRRNGMRRGRPSR